MNKINICFFNSSVAWGGGEKWHYDMAVRINQNRCKPYVIAGIKSELSLRLKPTDISFSTIGVSNLSFLNPFKIYRVYKILKREKIKIIIINLSEDVKLAGIASKLAGVRHVIYRRGSAIPIKNSLLNRLIFNYALTGIIANSQQTKRTILHNNPTLFPHEKIRVIYNGIFLGEGEKSVIEPFYQKMPGEVVIGNAGRLVRQKGQKYLIEIARKLKDQHIKFKLLIAGEGEYQEKLKQLANENGVSNEVLFLGFVKDMKQFMDTIDIFVLPSLWEGFGYVIVEAMAANKPVVAFDISSNPEIIVDGQTGYLVKDMDVDEFTRKISFLASNKSLREQMGSAGRLRVKELFDIEKTFEEFSRFIEAL